MGVARLVKVTVISSRSEYPEVVKALAKFRDFHTLEHASPTFDPKVQELDVRAVKLFSQVDQAVKDLGLNVEPGWMDQVFRGVKIEKSTFKAAQWEELLSRVEQEVDPVVQEAKSLKALLQRATKEETDAQNLMDALKGVSGLSANLEGLGRLHRLRTVVCLVGKEVLPELTKSIPEAVFVSQSLNEQDEVVLIAVREEEGMMLERTIKALEIKPLTIPLEFPQNPSEAYAKLSTERDTAAAKKAELESQLAKLGAASGKQLLASRELAEAARDMLDEARASGQMKRMATVSGYIPASEQEEFRSAFGEWIVYSEQVGHEEETPVLFENRKGVKLWQLVTAEQGIPGNEEVDPTPLISFVFPIFFGLMFGDVGHGLLFTLFVLFVRQRVTGTKRQWANIFLVVGVSSIFFGALFGEFFGFSLYSVVPIPPLIEIIQRPLNGTPSPNIVNIEIVMVVAILIGIAHLITGLGLDVYERWKAGEKLELVTEHIPALTMYISGLGYGISFIGAGFKFDVLGCPVCTAPAPLIGIPIDLLGGISLAVLVPSMLVILLGRAIAVKAGRLEGISFAGALSNGGLEVFEKILQFLSNTISYIRLAVMLLVHAVLLVIVSPALTYMFPIFVPLWVIFNLLILALEALIVYVQDLRLHVYEFFTKFYAGNGKPFRRILPDRARISISWT